MKQIFFLLFLLSFIYSGKGQNTSKPIGINSPYDPSADIVSCGLKDKSGNLWFAASGRGAYRYDPSASLRAGGKDFTNFTEKDGLSGNDVSCIYEDKSGDIWFGTNGGLCSYNGKIFTAFTIPSADSSNVSPLKYSHSQNTRSIVSILQDKTGNFWFVTLHHGVYRYDPVSGRFTNFLSYEVLQCILEDNTGNIWVGSWVHGGVYRYDPSTTQSAGEKSLHTEQAGFKNVSGFSDDMISCMFKDKAGNIWIGTRYHGVDRYDPSASLRAAEKSITNFSTKDGLCNNNVSCIFEDKTGYIWFGSDAAGWGTKRGDVCFYDGKSFTNVTAKEGFTTKENLGYSIRTIVEDKTGNIWFGSRGGHLFRYDGGQSNGSAKAESGGVNRFTDFSEKVSKE